jgi:hypothetical protein
LLWLVFGDGVSWTIWAEYFEVLLCIENVLKYWVWWVTPVFQFSQHLRGRNRRIESSRLSWATKWDPVSKSQKENGAGGSHL